MSKRREDLTKQLREAFIAEAHEQVQALFEHLVKLETEEPATQKEHLKIAFRHTHNLKGSARAVAFSNIEALCHPMEDIFAALNDGRIKANHELIEILLTGVCAIQSSIESADPTAGSPEITTAREKLQALTFQLGLAQPPEVEAVTASTTGEQASAQEYEITSVAILPEPATTKQQKTEHSSEATSPKTTTGSRSEVLRIPAQKLNVFLQKAEEMLSTKAMARQQAICTQELNNTTQNWVNSWSKASPEVKAFRQYIDKLRGNGMSPKEQSLCKKLYDILDRNSEYMDVIQGQVKTLVRTANGYSHATSSAVDILLDETKKLFMMPCSSMLSGFPMLVRQLAKELGKEAEFTMSGGEIDLDKRILSSIKDPLVHILRNCLDHGLEAPDKRLEQGKPKRGSLSVNVSQVDASTVEIRVKDDGRGIDPEHLKATAVKKGILMQEEANHLTNEQATALIFRSAFSTSQIITEISGRGIGLAIVDEEIRRLGGRIKIESQPSKGTTFIISLPVTISTFRGVLVQAAKQVFVVPTITVDRVVRVEKKAVKSVEGVDTMLLGDRLIPLCLLEDTLSLSSPFESTEQENKNLLTVIVLGTNEMRIGFIVDEILEEQEVLVKNLGPILANVPNVAGVTILGSGKVVPILNVSDMLKFTGRRRSINEQENVQTSLKQKRRTATKAQRKILVVDDTLTARILLKNLFESAGFNVKVAIDGADAMSALKAEKFDLVVTDVDMPKMDGFELTEAIRADKEMAALPVIIVTSRTSNEHREKGVAVGASAYFVKSSFDQTNLLDVIGSLV